MKNSIKQIWKDLTGFKGLGLRIIYDEEEKLFLLQKFSYLNFLQENHENINKPRSLWITLYNHWERTSVEEWLFNHLLKN